VGKYVKMVIIIDVSFLLLLEDVIPQASWDLGHGIMCNGTP
jgi:hypothetical protein